MATYKELFDIYSDGALLSKITIAVAKASSDVISEDPLTPNHAERLAWAQAGIKDPGPHATEMAMSVLLQNQAQTVDYIENTLSDTDLQNQVNSLINTFALN